jgi:hypothetical protein
MFLDLLQSSSMKRAHTDEHAQSGIDAVLPEIDMAESVSGYEIRFVMEFTSGVPEDRAADFAS